MALHRDIYWVGRQWAVTGYGVQACNQKQKSQFDIEGARLWEAGVVERLRAEPWVNIDDFEKALEVARRYFPEPPRPAARPEPVAPDPELPISRTAPVRPVAAPMPAVPKFELRMEACAAKFVRTWRIRVQR